MKTPTAAELKTLVKQQGQRCLSIFMPTHKAGSGAAEDQLRLRNLLRAAEARLLSDGWRVPDAAKLLRPAHDLLENSLVWRNTDLGLAIFLAPDSAQYFGLPFTVDERWVVAARFHIKPLLPILDQQGEFYVLALSQNQARLYHGDRFELTEVRLEHVPHGLAEVVQYDSWQKEVRVRSGAPAGVGRWSSIYYGSGGEADARRDELVQYCQRVDRAVRDALGTEQKPIVLAGVSPLVALYREVSQYSHLADTAIRGNPEHVDPAELHAEALGLLRPHFDRRRTEAADTYRRLADTRRASSDLLKIVRAAHTGRVQTLFVAVDRDEPGIYDAESQAIYLSSGSKIEGDDLLDLAAAQCLLAGGEVFGLPSAEMPSDEPLAAVLRY